MRIAACPSRCSAALAMLFLLSGLAGCGNHTQSADRIQQQDPPAAEQKTDQRQVTVDSALPELLSDQELADGWIALFDGQTTFGWVPTTQANWKVDNGTLTVSSGEPGLLRTTTEFSEYVLRVDYRAEAGTNSGVFLHALDAVGPQDVSQHCYELNIAGADHPFPTGSLVGRKAVTTAPPEDNQWHTFQVTLQGDQVTVELDGKQVLTYTDPQPLGRGYIGLQLNQGQVSFRNVQLKPLSLESLFNGRDLSGWKTYPDMDSDFSVTEEGLLHVRSGPGQLESEQQYEDFVLQLECKTHAQGLNSGIFFRCIPGQRMNGYESQIHNAFRSGDRTDPLDYGTGAIFRRQKARRVVADDLEWFTKTIIAHGPHMAVWVNGYPVTDWTDDRAPHENPRQGLRVAAGTLMIQGHDPTTDISFRNLRAAEMQDRFVAEGPKPAAPAPE